MFSSFKNGKTSMEDCTEAKFKEFEPRLKYGWFHLKLYSMFQLRSVETGFWQI